MVQSDRRQFLANVGAAGATAVSLGIAGCSGGGGGDGGNGGDGGPPTVDMTDELVYDPDSITISVGDTVVWENVGNVGHSVTAYEDDIPEDADYFASGGFDSEAAAREAYTPGDTDAGDIPGGESFEHTFQVPGTFEYFCIPHESAEMTGTVEVES